MDNGNRVGMDGGRASEQREHRRHERRTHDWRTVAWGAFLGRRGAHRRGGDADALFLDVYGLPLLVSSIGLIGLCVVDGLFTLIILAGGGHEVNPVMAVVLEQHADLFLPIKLTLTLLALLLLLLYHRYRLMKLVPVGSLVHLGFFGYVGLIGYEWLLLGRM
jgi:hypothetical protein